MSASAEVTRAQEIAQVTIGSPHVVLLGAGASRAAFPSGDRSGRLLPLMADLVDVVDLRSILAGPAFPVADASFETLYSVLTSTPGTESLRLRLDDAIYNYFASLEMPDEPTLYDHLLLSLRPKDVIATFNWDPFLILAARRNGILKGRIPKLLFLHGNVAAGFCPTDRVHGTKGTRCSRCGHEFIPSRLLYPTTEKDYHHDPMLLNAWQYLTQALEKCFMFTVFGYSASKSDRSAIELLQSAWGESRRRRLEQTEIIDIRRSLALTSQWDAFIHTHHFETHADFYDSWLAHHPRRSGEAYWNQYLEAKFIADNRIPRTVGFDDLWSWFDPLIQAELNVGNADNGSLNVDDRGHR